MGTNGDLRLLLASRHPLIMAESQDEPRLMSILTEAAATLELPVWTWSSTRGLAGAGQDPQYRTTDAKAALDFLHDLRGPGVFVFADAHHALTDPAVVRRVKEFAQEATPGQTLVLTSPSRRLPPELHGLALPWTLEPPNPEELEAVVRRTMEDLSARNLPVTVDRDDVAALADSLRGVSLSQAGRLVTQAALRDGALAPDDVEYMRGAKAELLEPDGALEVVDESPLDLEEVGGLARLKEWLALRSRAMAPQAAEAGLDPPRGILLTGVPGCGKSLVAKAVARAWGYPLLLLDPGRLFGPYVGESEQRLADALDTVESMAPAVLWVDEIEKGLSSRGEGDGGVSRRILGTFLRWMQERPPGIFIMATCNDVEALPPELMRKGRFDEVFFVDLPDREEREAIFRVHLARRRREPSSFDLPRLAALSEGFSGAEIEAAVVGAVYRAYAAGGELTTAGVVEELEATAPLSRSRPGDVARLRAWADGRAVMA